MKRVLLINMRLCLFAWIGSTFISGCTYYKPIQKSVSDLSVEKIQNLKERQIIIHSKQGLFLLENVSIDTSVVAISGTLGKVPPQHLKYINDTRERYRYSKKDNAVLKEAHLYSDIGKEAIQGSEVTIVPGKIDQLIFIQKDKAKNTLTAIGLGFAGVSIIIFIYLLFNPPVTGI